MNNTPLDCVLIVQLMARQRLAETEEEQRRIEAEFREHLSVCYGCAQFYRELQQRQSSEARQHTWHSKLVLEEAGSDTQAPGRPVSTLEFERSDTMQDVRQTGTTKEKGKFFTLFVDGKEYHVEKGELTGAEIMDLGGIPREVGLILIEEDGTQLQIHETDVVELKSGRRFKKAPRFIRG